MRRSARLHRLVPAPVGECRVLEIGCAAGGNLIPMAAALPRSRFLGIDFSAVQVRVGTADVAALGLANVELKQVGPARFWRRIRRVRLHHRARRLFVGTGRRAGKAARRLLAAVGARRHRLRQLQHPPRLEHARNRARRDALSHAPVSGRSHPRATSPRHPGLPGGGDRGRSVALRADAAFRGRAAAPQTRLLRPARSSRGIQRSAFFSSVRRTRGAPRPRLPRRSGIPHDADRRPAGTGRTVRSTGWPRRSWNASS